MPLSRCVAESGVIWLVGKDLLKPLDIASYLRVSSDASHSFRGLKGVVMQLALRPYATAGVALVGASVIAVSPVAVPPTAVEQVRESAVHLSALANPFEAFQPVLQNALADL